MQSARTFLRSAKNFTYGYTDMQIKVREATSNDPCGPTTHSMNEIASATFDDRKFREVMSIIRKRLNDHGKNWRHVYKSLLIIDYCIQFGSERVIEFAQKNIQLIKTLKEFQFIDSEGRDHGASVRQKSKELTAALIDMNQLNSDRDYARSRKDRLGFDSGSRTNSSHSLPAMDRGINGGLREDEAIRAAIEESSRGVSRSQTNLAANSSRQANNAPLIDFMSDESEDSLGQSGPSASSYSQQLHNQLCGPQRTPQLAGPYQPMMLQSSNTNMSYFNPTGYNEFPNHFQQSPAMTTSNPFQPTNYNATISSEVGQFANSKSSLFDNKSFYSQPEANQSGVFNETDNFLPSNPFLSTEQKKCNKELVDLSAQSLLTDPFASKSSVDPFAAKSSVDPFTAKSTVDPFASSSDNNDQSEMSLFQLQLEKTKRGDNLFQ